MTDDRTKYIGGSDIGAIVGLSPWRSPLDVYLEKTGQGREVVVTERMRWGTLLEPLILAEYSKRENRKVRRVTKPFVHPKHDFIRGHVDAMSRSDDGSRVVVEAKATSNQWDEVPDYYQTQVQWYMTLAKANVAHVAALVSGQYLSVYKVAADEEAQKALIEIAVEFWTGHVLAGVPPAPRSEADVQKLWSAKTGKQIVATAEIERLAREIADIRAKIGALEEEEQGRRDRIAAYMMDATELIAPNGEVLLSYSGYTRRSTDWQKVIQKLSARLPIDELGTVVGECTAEKEVRTMRLKLKTGE
jgi:putative phage-type endonuclease